MKLNPELRRNAWLELTAHRLLAMPAILLLLFLLARLTSGDYWNLIAIYALIIFVAVTVLWGGKLAGEGLIREIDGQTWDGQRMSVIGPWSMTWGKLFGSTLFAWYGGVIALLAYLVARNQVGVALPPFKVAALMVLVAVLVQALGLLGALLIKRKQSRPGSRRYTGLYLLAVLALLWLLPFIQNAGLDSGVSWYGERYPLLDFVLASLLLWSGWALVGIYRVMRIELQFTNAPWIWLLFVATVLLYLSGFIHGKGMMGAQLELLRLIVSFAISGIIFYFVLFSESKDVVVLRRLGQRIKERNWSAASENIPLWLLTLMVVTGLVLGLMVKLPLQTAFAEALVLDRWFPLATLLFMVRDTALLLALNLGRRTRWADGAALVYLFVLYGLLPALFNLAGAERVLTIFYPHNDGGLSGVIPPLLEMAAMLLLVRHRLRRASREVAIS